MWATTTAATRVTASLSIPRSVVHGVKRGALGAAMMPLELFALREHGTALGVAVPAESDDVVSRIVLLVLDVNRGGLSGSESNRRNTNC